MELVKHSPEELEQIERDRSRPHCVVTMFAPLTTTNIFQDAVSDVTERAMIDTKARADRARMQILNTSLSTNVAVLEDGSAYVFALVLCQWATIEKIEEMQRRALLGAGGMDFPPRRGA